MVPGTKDTKIAKDVAYTPDGFVDTSAKKGVYAVGTLKSPVDVARSAQDATGVVIKSIQSLRRK
jgi:quinone-modifying oxidoreductase subunit QmoA